MKNIVTKINIPVRLSYNGSRTKGLVEKLDEIEREFQARARQILSELSTDGYQITLESG